MTSPKPSVSFVIVAYNQERYIQAAVEGAFAQTYSPLEILLSDDRSADATPAIMAQMAADYTGPHEVRFIANPENQGIVRHVFARGREARGDIVVIAAGDDISVPDRTAALVEIFRKNPDALAVTSGYDVIDEDGRLLEENRGGNVWGRAASARSTYVAGVPMTDYVEIQGSTASYRRSLFDTALPPWSNTGATRRRSGTGPLPPISRRRSGTRRRRRRCARTRCAPIAGSPGTMPTPDNWTMPPSTKRSAPQR
jgi:glycosyltransferase involved in cell wall biosynthesis